MGKILWQAGWMVLMLWAFQAKMQHIQYKEEALRTREYAQEAMQSFLSGLGGASYPVFRESTGATALTLLQIFPGAYSAKSSPQIIYTPPHEINVVYRPVGYCIDMTATLVYDLLVFPLSSFTSMTICGACDVSLKFGQNSKPVETKLKVAWNITNFALENGIMKLFGLDTLILGKLKTSPKWAQYMDGIIQTAWTKTAALLYASNYNAYKMNVNYESGSVGLRLPFLSGAVSSSRLELEYAPAHTSLVPAIQRLESEERVAHIHSLDSDVLKELYGRAMELKWSIYADPTTLPSNLSVKLNTATFGQVIPDMLLKQLDKNLSVTVYPNVSKLTVKVLEEFNEVHVNNLTFTIIVHDWNKELLLAGIFNIHMRLSMSLQCNGYSAKLIPTVTQTTVEVTTLRSPSYSTVIKSGMARIIQKLIQEYYMKLYMNRTLSEGIPFTFHPENPDPTKSSVSISSNHVKVTIAYRSS